jgi:hypothetical protein
MKPETRNSKLENRNLRFETLQGRHMHALVTPEKLETRDPRPENPCPKIRACRMTPTALKSSRR